MGQSCIKEVATKELRMKRKDRAQKRGFKGSMQRKNSNQQEAQQIKQEEVGEGLGGEGVRGCKERWVVVFHQIVLLQACGRQLLLPDFFALGGCRVQIVREG